VALDRYKPKKPTVYFTNGCVIHKDFVAVSCGSLADPEAATSVITFYDGKRWGGQKVQDDRIVSFAYSAETNTLYALGKFGAIISVQAAGEFSFDTARGRLVRQDLPGASEGNLSSIAASGKIVFACGWSGKLYELYNQNWRVCSTGLPGQDDHDFLDLCCVDGREVYAVGMKGVIYYFDGQHWYNLDSPTNQHLQAITSVRRDEIYIVGKKGGIYKGNKDGWQFIGDPSVTVDFWGVREFGGKLLMSGGTDALYMHDGTSISKVDMGIEYLVNTHKLDCRDGALWSFGIDDLVKYEGKSWEYVVCSMNQ
jgi:hypothetical protein